MEQLGEYQILQQLGVGSYATVYQCKKNQGLETVAVKVVAKNDPVSYNTLLNGFKILKQLGTKTNNRELEIGKKYIVTFLDTVETSTHFGVVMEEIKGMELFDYVLKNHVVIHGEALGLSEPVAKVIMKQILLAMAYIHSADIVHEDMKLENVMVINTLDGPLIKVIDFGLGHKVTEPSIAKGSDAYQSPETIMNLERNPIKSDIWACGIILFSMLTSRLPFDKETVRQELIQMNDQGRRSMLRRIAVGTFQYREVENQQLSTECKQVIQHMLTRNQEYRMNASELLQLEWFKNI